MITPLIANTLKAERLKRHMNQEEFAIHLGMSRPNYNNVENGRRGISLQEMKRIFTFLNIPEHKIKEMLYDVYLHAKKKAHY